MDVEAVRTFVAVADEGQIQIAAQELGVSQQAASKRIAALERQLGVRLFTRTPRGARLTLDGQAFLPHAKAVVRAVERAAGAVAPGRRPLRVDVMGTRVSVAGLVQDFHREHPDVALDVVATAADGRAVLAAVRDGNLDAGFWARRVPEDQLPSGVRSTRVYDEPMLLVTGTGHPLAGAETVAMADLAGHRISMPGLAEGSEWAAYYAELAREFRLDIDTSGPSFGSDYLLQTVAGSATAATFMGPRTPLAYPAGLDLRTIPVRDPMPVYPHSLLWRADNPHPGLTALRAYLAREYAGARPADHWTPDWEQAARR
ncbi:LysR family transcriptional regulator [Streptomyces longispororuber]|uniref:LysR family transcriptional regulator n=1 Tax=Streptomyces longispororuber TaxID=68230 RepID=UPI00210EEA79|nr:LysR family transcriptional regulator [Streptomyces longispororuber]MCQ4207856.1 LysR family transcriptional regulator [Streptomyces longispororuber]